MYYADKDQVRYRYPSGREELVATAGPRHEADVLATMLNRAATSWPRDTLAQRHLVACHADGSECEDGCDVPALPPGPWCW
jgi:hypothetical protein